MIIPSKRLYIYVCYFSKVEGTMLTNSSPLWQAVVVDYLIERPEVARVERIEALELVGPLKHLVLNLLIGTKSQAESPCRKITTKISFLHSII